MGLCYYCHWGWPKPIADIYDKYLEIAGQSAMHFGPAHVVWEDENFERHLIEWCLVEADTYRAYDCTDEEHEAVKQSLRELLTLPDAIFVVPEGGWDDPDKHPPHDGIERVRR